MVQGQHWNSAIIMVFVGSCVLIWYRVNTGTMLFMVFVGSCVVWCRVDTGTMLSYDVCRGLCYMVQGQHYLWAFHLIKIVCSCSLPEQTPYSDMWTGHTLRCP